jgi:predicted AAA+ superfamily ATPase
MSDLIKQYANNGTNAPIYFWRDLNGRTEIDCLLNRGGQLIAIEMKARETGFANYFDGLLRWNEIAKTSPDNNYVIYAGEHTYRNKKGNLVNWQASGNLVNKLEDTKK